MLVQVWAPGWWLVAEYQYPLAHNVGPSVSPRMMASCRVPIPISPQLKDELDTLTANALVDELTPGIRQEVVVKKRSGGLWVNIDHHLVGIQCPFWGDRFDSSHKRKVNFGLTMAVRLCDWLCSIKHWCRFRSIRHKCSPASVLCREQEVRIISGACSGLFIRVTSER